MKIRCIKEGLDFTLNKVYEIKNNKLVDDVGYNFSFYDIEIFNNSFNYNSSCKFEEVKEESNFKIGDRVKIIKDNWNKCLLNKIGTIVNIDNSNHWNIGVKFNEFIDGHDCRAKCENGYGWDFMIDEIELIEENKNLIYPISTKEMFESISTSISDKFDIVKKVEFIYGNNEKKEGNNMEILKIYKNRKSEQIRESHEIEIEKIYKEDENLKEYYKIKDSIEEYNKKLAKQNLEVLIALYTNDKFERLTIDSKEKYKKLVEDKEKQLDELNNLIKEVEAILELCETEESKIEKLKLYEILNKGGKINA